MFGKFLDENQSVLGDGAVKYKVRVATRIKRIEMLNQIDRACLFEELRPDPNEFDLAEDYPIYSYAEIANLIINDEDLRQSLRLNWRVPSENYATTIRRSINFYRNSIEETIHGIFPAKF